MQKTIVFDFDGVIHSYVSGWQGAATVIPDPPVKGIDQALYEIKKAGYKVVIYSTRCATLAGRVAIESWLDKWGLDTYVDEVAADKPPAYVYVDDRAICFDGHAETLLDKINNFKTWQNSAI